MVIASAAAVASSNKEELAISMLVRSETIVWKLRRDSSLQSKLKSRLRTHCCRGVSQVSLDNRKLKLVSSSSQRSVRAEEYRCMGTCKRRSLLCSTEGQ